VYRVLSITPTIGHVVFEDQRASTISRDVLRKFIEECLAPCDEGDSG
jgi:hypothetical protein